MLLIFQFNYFSPRKSLSYNIASKESLGYIYTYDESLLHKVDHQFTIGSKTHFHYRFCPSMVKVDGGNKLHQHQFQTGDENDDHHRLVYMN